MTQSASQGGERALRGFPGRGDVLPGPEARGGAGAAGVPVLPRAMDGLWVRGGRGGRGAAAAEHG